MPKESKRHRDKTRIVIDTEERPNGGVEPDVSTERRICPSPQRREKKDFKAILTPAQVKGLKVFFENCDRRKNGRVKMADMLREVRNSPQARILFSLDNPEISSTNVTFNKIFSEMADGREVTFYDFLSFFYRRWKAAQDTLLDDTAEVMPLALSTAAGHRVIANNLDATCLIRFQDTKGMVQGTGSLVNEGYILTASSVLPSYEAAATAEAVFFYEKDATGVIIRLRPDKLFHQGKPISMQGEMLGFVVCGLEIETLLEALEKNPKRRKTLEAGNVEIDIRALPHQQVNAMMGTVVTQINQIRATAGLEEKSSMVLIEHSAETSEKSYHSLRLARKTNCALLYDVHRASEDQIHKLEQSPGSPIFSLDGSLVALHMRSPVGFGLTEQLVRKRTKSEELAEEKFAIQAMSWGLRARLVVSDIRQSIHYCQHQAARHVFAGGRALQGRQLYRKYLFLYPSLARQYVLRALELLHIGEMKKATEFEVTCVGVREWDRKMFAKNIDLMKGKKLSQDSLQLFPPNTLNRDTQILTKSEEKGVESPEVSSPASTWTLKIIFTKVVEECSAGIAIDGERPCLYVVRAVAFMHLGTISKAIEDFTHVIGLEQAANNEGCEDRLADALCYRGSCYARLEDFKGAIQDFSKAIELKSDVAGYYFCRGNVSVHMEEKRQGACLDDIPSKDLSDSAELSRAVIDYTSALGLCEDFVYAFYHRGRVLSAQCKLAAAIRDYNVTLKLDPKHASALFNRGLCYQKKVREDFIESQSICPKKEIESAIVQVNQVLRYPAGSSAQYCTLKRMERPVRDEKGI
ncbi:hypothetical protein AAMO2058_000719100 [Amorphochlora amoebiformis]